MLKRRRKTDEKHPNPGHGLVKGGSVMDKDVSQIFETSMKRWIKYNNKTGKMIERGIDDKPFEDVKIETTVIRARTGYTPVP